MANEPLPAEDKDAPDKTYADTTGGTVLRYPATAAAQSASAHDESPAGLCPLTVNEHDERGNTVKYIYACDKDYVVYYSRLEHAAGSDRGLSMPLGARLRRFLRAGRRSRPVFDAAYESEGVQAQLSSDPLKRQQQRRLLLPLGNERARLQALLSRWPRRYSYDTRIATALQMALDGDNDSLSAKCALDTLVEARSAILAERETAGRAQYVTYTVMWGIVGLLASVIVCEGLLDGNGMLCRGVQAGLVGAILSIAISIRRRQVALNIDRAANLTDSLLRLFIGAVSGGALVLLFATRLLPTLHTLAGDLDVETSQDFAMLLGLTAGFVEQLVPSMLEKQGEQFTSGNSQPPAPGDRADAKA